MTRTLLAALLIALCAAAQPLLSPQSAVETALQSHPLLRAGASKTEAASGYLTQAGLRPNPRLTLQAENFRAYGSPTFLASRDADYYAYLLNPIETGGKRDRRRELAAAGLERSQTEREVLARQIALRVSLAYWSAAGAERVHQLLVESNRNFEQMIDYHYLRVRLGAMAEADLLKVKLEGDRLRVATEAAALEADRARIALFREMGQGDFPVVRFIDLPDDLHLVNANAAATDSPIRPELKFARQIVVQARANLRLQSANARPDIDIIFGYKRTAGFDTVIGGIQMNLPFSNRNQGLIAAAEAEVRASEFELAAAEASIRAEIRSAQAEVNSRQKQLTELFGDSQGAGLRGKAVESSRIAQAAYREGGTDLLRLLDAERVRIETQVLYYKTLAEYRQSLAALDAALGVTP